MENQDFTTAIVVKHTPQEVFEAVNRPQDWWSQEITGGTSRLNDEFHYHYRDVHSCNMRITEFTPDKRVVWKVLDNHFNFVQDQTEWLGTEVIFDITPQGDETQVRLTHKGLVPAHECYQICHDAWTGYIQKSLRSLIETGEGQPNPKE